MSRTRRRSNEQLSRRYLSFATFGVTYDVEHNQARDLEHALERAYAKFHRCRKSGLWSGSTHYVRRTHYNVPERRLVSRLCREVAVGLSDDVVLPGRKKGVYRSHLWSLC